MIILIGILVWFILGSLAVILAGYCDKLENVNDAPKDIIFFLGPFWLIISLLAFIWILLEKNNLKISIIDKLYDLGNK